MKRYYLTAAVVCLLALLAASFVYDFWSPAPSLNIIRVGFLSENDEMTASTYNFEMSRNTLEKTFPGHIEVEIRQNIQAEETEDVLEELVQAGCSIIFTNTRSKVVRSFSEKYPDVQFCQLSGAVPAATDTDGNYHTFNARYYEAHYIGGVVAGMKLREMIDSGIIQPEEALVGYVGTFRNPEIVSGFTAFILGVRSEAPEAVMRVRFTDTSSNFSREKNAAKRLIDEGCVIIAQNSGTSGPVSACQEASADRPVYHVGFNESFIDTGSMVTLVTPGTNWDPYMVNAVQAVRSHLDIEKFVSGSVHGNDICAGFDQQWLEIIGLDGNLAAPGTAEKVQQVISDIISGRLDIFRGDYIGVDLDNIRLRIDLNGGYTENSESSEPTFHYILRNVVTVEKE